MITFLKQRRIESISADQCPLSKNNCMFCSFFCGTTISLKYGGLAAQCGFNKDIYKIQQEREKHLDNENGRL